jgi:hypothetical protein
MFAVLHSDINSPKSGLLHMTGQPYCKKSRSPKVKDGTINLILRNYLVDQYTSVDVDSNDKRTSLHHCSINYHHFFSLTNIRLGRRWLPLIYYSELLMPSIIESL